MSAQDKINELVAEPAVHAAANAELRKLAVETDTKLAKLDGEYAGINSRGAAAAMSVHNYNGERAVYVRRQRTFVKPIEESVAELQAKLAAGEIEPYNVAGAEKALATLVEASKAAEANRTEAARLHEVWAANGHWSRFYWVKGNGGHLHYDISGWRCSRTPRTDHGWNPELSGATEAEAVAAMGPSLCTKCFPSAPVEWTVGKAKPARCPGSGKSVPSGKRVGMRYYATCPDCGEFTLLTQYSGIRAHKPKPAE